MKDKDEEPSVWVTALKLVLGGAVFIGVVGFALWYAVEMVGAEDLSKPPETVERSWGIVNDNPARPRN